MHLSRFQGDATATGAQPLCHCVFCSEEPLCPAPRARLQVSPGRQAGRSGNAPNFISTSCFCLLHFDCFSLFLHRRKKLIAGQTHRYPQHESFSDRGHRISTKKCPSPQASARLCAAQAPRQHRTSLSLESMMSISKEPRHPIMLSTGPDGAGEKEEKPQPWLRTFVPRPSLRHLRHRALPGATALPIQHDGPHRGPSWHKFPSQTQQGLLGRMCFGHSVSAWSRLR